MWLVQAIIWIGVLALLLWLMILLGLAALSLVAPYSPPSAVFRRLAVLIPAHNEAGLVRETVASVRAADYPPHLLRVVVVADNCDDRTAAEAVDAGAECLVRSDPRRRGKGYALRFGLSAILNDHREYDGVVFLDADSTIDPDFLKYLSGHLTAPGAIVQGCYTVAEPQRSWLTRLTHLGFVLKNRFQYPGLNWLGLSVPLRGSGMCISRDVLEAQGWGSVSLTEDLDFSVTLIRRGYRIVYEPRAVNRQYMPPTLATAAVQRTRWSRGEIAVSKQQIWAFLRESVKKRDWPRTLQAVYLMAPPFSSLFLIALALTGAALAPTFMGVAAFGWLASLCLAVSGFYAVYFLIALTVTGFSWDYVVALLMIPVYALWRTGIHLSSRWFGASSGWSRTPRL